MEIEGLGDIKDTLQEEFPDSVGRVLHYLFSEYNYSIEDLISDVGKKETLELLTKACSKETDQAMNTIIDNYFIDEVYGPQRNRWTFFYSL